MTTTILVLLLSYAALWIVVILLNTAAGYPVLKDPTPERLWSAAKAWARAWWEGHHD